MSNLPAKIAIPTLNELVSYTETFTDTIFNDKLKTYLNQNPPKAWLKDHPTATKEIKRDGQIYDVPIQFLPIDKHELLLDTIFQEWKVEVLREGVMFHSIYVTVRVWYKVQGNKTWYFHDGVGAMKAQTDKGGSAADLSKIKFNAVQIGLPAAKSYAIKDANEHLGNLFGRNINRADTLPFEGKYKEDEPVKKDEEEIRVEELMKLCKTRDKLSKYKEHCLTPDTRNLYDELWAKLKL